MINIQYPLNENANPYTKTSERIKIGDIVYNKSKNVIERVDYKLLGKIIKNDHDDSPKKYYLIHLTEKWITDLFGFEKYFLHTKYINVFTSKSNGLKLHNQPYGNQNFTLGYRFLEKNHDLPYYKPTIYFVNELMSYIFLIKKQQFYFNDESLKYINNNIETFVTTYLYN